MSLTLMTPAERESYAAWLIRFFANRKGRIAEHFRRIANVIKNDWEST